MSITSYDDSSDTYDSGIDTYDGEQSTYAVSDPRYTATLASPKYELLMPTRDFTVTASAHNWTITLV